jgi:hypothetical protein
MRSLFLFATPNKKESDHNSTPISELTNPELTEDQLNTFYAATAFHHDKYPNYTLATEWLSNQTSSQKRICAPFLIEKVP